MKPKNSNEKELDNAARAFERTQVGRFRFMMNKIELKLGRLIDSLAWRWNHPRQAS